MAFRVLEGAGRTYWVAMDGASTYYIGQIVAFNSAAAAATNGTVVPLTVSNATADATLKQVVAGVVVGFNNRVQYTNATGQYDGGVCVIMATQLARDWIGAEGMYAKGDPQNLCQIAEITPNTVLRGDIRSTALTTAPTLMTATAGSATGGTGAWTTNATDHTPVARYGTIYMRSGANAGLYRVNVNTVTTAPQVVTAFPYAVAIGDTCIEVPLKQGISAFYIGGPGLYIDSSVGVGTNTNFHAVVYSVDLKVAFKETADFRFSAAHFSLSRTT